MTREPYVLLFLDPVLYIVLQFFNNLKHIILRADNMKKNQPVNQGGLHTKTNRNLVVLHETFTSLGEGMNFSR